MFMEKYADLQILSLHLSTAIHPVGCELPAPQAHKLLLYAPLNTKGRGRNKCDLITSYYRKVSKTSGM